jgi:hypothetical protein
MKACDGPGRVGTSQTLERLSSGEEGCSVQCLWCKLDYSPVAMNKGAHLEDWEYLVGLHIEHGQVVCD